MANAKREEVVLVFDCGATNLKAVAVDPQGEIVAQARVGPTVLSLRRAENLDGLSGT